MQTAALILGVLALAFIFVPVLNLMLSPMLAVSALVMGLISSSGAKRKGEDSQRGTAGATTGAIALVLSLLLIGGLALTVMKMVGEGREKASVTEQVDRRFDELESGLREDISDEIRDEVREQMDREREERARKWLEEHPHMPPGEAWKQHFEERMDDWIRWIEQMPLTPDPAFGPGGPFEGTEPAGPPLPPPPEPVAKKAAPAKLPPARDKKSPPPKNPFEMLE